MSTAQNKYIKSLESKILKLEKELIASKDREDKLQERVSKYITNVKIAQGRDGNE